MAERGSKRLHLLDRYIGVPLVRFLGLFVNKNKQIPTQIKRIAIFRTAAIGDTVLLSAIIKDIKEQLPFCEVVLFAGPSNYAVTPLLPGLDMYLKLPVKNLIASYKIIRQTGCFDICIDTGQWPRLDAILSFMCKAAYRIGFITTEQHKHYLFHKNIMHLNSVHEIQNFKNLIKPFGIRKDNLPSLQYKLSSKIKEIIQSAKDRYIVLHPWAGGTKSHIKEWPNIYWIALIEYLFKMNFNIFITGAEKDFHNSQRIISNCPATGTIKNMAGKLSLEETVALVSHAAILICVNTGIMHIGSALDIPVIDLNGPTKSTRWGPLNGKSIPINSPGEGCGFINLGFEYQGNPVDCMSKITVEMVLKAVTKICSENIDRSKTIK
jgi:ADP-heptose:LPS heptosyltransferase